jgi:phosphoribosylglycinamide formyltransferase 1
MPTISQPVSPAVSLGVLASGNGSNLEAIAEGSLNAKIAVAIYNNPEAYVRQRAERLGIPTVLLNHRNYASREALDAAIIEVLVAHHVDLVIMAGWMRVVTQTLIDAFPKRILNIHPSLLPSFPGIHAIDQALNYGVKISGCTVHLVSLEVDCGPILQQAAVPVLPDDTPSSLQQRIQVQEHLIYPSAIAAYCQKIQRQKIQPECDQKL